jgi:signal transduction histidine kinase
MATAAPTGHPPPAPSRWELAAEAIAVRIRWFGLLVAYVLVNVDARADEHRPLLNALLTLGTAYTLLDTWFSLRGRVFLGRYPLSVSIMEALFIGLLCYYHGGLDSPFRYYYFLSLVCCAIRYPAAVAYATCGLHAASFTLLYFALPDDRREPLTLLLTLVVLGWVSWAGVNLALLLKRLSDHLAHLNGSLQANQAHLEARIAQRTLELQEAQAHLLHQEKMAAFGLLAAGIAHEVGNPLTSISSLVQLLQQRQSDGYSQEKLALVSGQLQRIRGTLRELTNFSRPASTVRSRCSVEEVLEEALNIAKYYKGTKGRVLTRTVPPGLLPLFGVRDQLVQVFLNLVLNAIDATARGGRIELAAADDGGFVRVSVRDDGAGIDPTHADRLFRPYFTTKKHGTGLGLFVTRKLVADHGGTVEFESRPGSGTVFFVRLPASPTGSPEGAAVAVADCSGV